MKVKDVKSALELFDQELEVRIMDITNEEFDEVTYCPAYDFKIVEMKEGFISLQFNPDKPNTEIK